MSNFIYVFWRKNVNLISPFKRLTKFELCLWLLSVCTVSFSSVFGEDFSIMSLSASLVGVTALIFVARGDVFGQILTVIFAILYAVVSWELKYYGEMITYLCMTAPIAFMSIISWLRHPYKNGNNEVKITRMSKAHIIFMSILAIFVTVVFYFMLEYFGNAQLFVSTISITTSFVASYLMFCRSPYYALAYALNDIVLIVLWIVASFESISYLAMVMCFVMFFVNDIYAYFNWQKMHKRQQKGE